MLQISPLQILLSAISAMMIIQAISQYAKQEQGQTFFKLFTSLFIWIAIFAFSLFPEFSHIITRQLGFGENLNTLIFLGFIIIFFILNKLIRVIERIERNISEIVRKEALEKITREK